MNNQQFRNVYKEKNINRYKKYQKINSNTAIIKDFDPKWNN